METDDLTHISIAHPRAQSARCPQIQTLAHK